MDGVTTLWQGRGWLATVVNFARREPGRALAVVLGLHLFLWTLIPILVCRNLQLDLAEELALGREWQLGYWKHPPLPWWAADLVHRLTGQIDAVYVLGPLAAVICLYGVWLLARETLGAFEGLLAVLALEGVHFYNFSVVKFAHDQLQLPFWAFTGLFFYRACKRGRQLDWVLAGSMLAGAFWSKYAAFVLAATLGLFLLVDPVARRNWRTPGPYLMLAAFLVVLGPNIWWLFGHDFLPFQYLNARARVAAHDYQYISYSLRWIAGQAFFLLPTGILLALLYRGNKSGPGQLSDDAAFDRRYATWLALGPFAVTTVIAIAFGRLAISMWGYPLWSFAPLALLMWFRPNIDMPTLRRFAVGFIIVFFAFPVSYIAVEIGEPFLRDRPKATQFPGRALADLVTAEWHARYGTPLTYVGGSEFVTNNVAVYSADRPHVVVHGLLRLSPWIDKDELRRHGAVLVWEEGLFGGDVEHLRETFGDVEVQPIVVLPRQTLHPVPPARINFAIVPPLP